MIDFNFGFYETDENGKYDSKFINGSDNKVVGYTSSKMVELSELKVGDSILVDPNSERFKGFYSLSITEIKDNEIGGKDIYLELIE